MYVNMAPLYSSENRAPRGWGGANFSKFILGSNSEFPPVSTTTGFCN